MELVFVLTSDLFHLDFRMSRFPDFNKATGRLRISLEFHAAQVRVGGDVQRFRIATETAIAWRSKTKVPLVGSRFSVRGNDSSSPDPF